MVQNTGSKLNGCVHELRGSGCFGRKCREEHKDQDFRGLWPMTGSCDLSTRSEVKITSEKSLDFVINLRKASTHVQ